jgi:hypothetical protein
VNTVQEILDGRRGTVFAPRVTLLAAAVEGLEPEEMEDPAVAVYALEAARELFGLAVVIVTGTETVRRLAAQLGDRVPVVAALDRDAGAERARADLEAGAAALLLEDDGGAGATPIANIASFFGRPLLRAKELSTLPSDNLVGPPGEVPAVGPGLLLSDGEVPADIDPGDLRAWCDAFAAVDG